MRKLTRKKRIRKLAMGVLSLFMLHFLFLCPAVCAEETFSFEENFAVDGLGGTLERYLSEKKLTERSITIGWQDVNSGDEWFFGADIFREGASTYKLPLCMLYADWVSEGRLTKEDKIGVYTVDQAVREALVNSSNNAADALRYGVSKDHTEYRTAIAVNCGLALETLPSGYYTANQFSPRYLIGTLRTLWDNSEKYGWLLDYMKQAQPTSCFSRYRGSYEVAHKTGNALGYICDTGIVYTEDPFLLTVMSSGVRDADRVLGEIAHIAMDYAEFLAEKDTLSSAPKSISIDAETLYLRLGESRSLAVSFLPEGAEDHRPLVWTSSDESVAKVDDKGTVTGVNAGETIIRCTTKDETLSTECRVVVSRELFRRLSDRFQIR